MITPFKLFIKNNFPFIENTYEALDNYGLLCKIVEKLNEVVDSENQLNLKLDNFIDTLDVQAAVNDKLDEMAEDGTLAQIINVQLFSSLDERVTTNTSNINELNTRVGQLSELNTDQKLSIVKSINEVYFKLNYYIGNLQNLQTETKLDVVSAINEVNTAVLDTKEDIGNLDNLTTTVTATLVGAINEVNAKDIEINSTGNGTYFKFSNGILVCLKKVSGETAFTSLGEGMYKSSVIQMGDYPVAFVSAPFVSYSSHSPTGTWIGFSYTANELTSAGSVQLFKGANDTNNRAYTVYCIAIGFWK